MREYYNHAAYSYSKLAVPKTACILAWCSRRRDCRNDMKERGANFAKHISTETVGCLLLANTLPHKKQARPSTSSFFFFPLQRLHGCGLLAFFLFFFTASPMLNTSIWFRCTLLKNARATFLRKTQQLDLDFSLPEIHLIALSIAHRPTDVYGYYVIFPPSVI